MPQFPQEILNHLNKKHFAVFVHFDPTDIHKKKPLPGQSCNNENTLYTYQQAQDYISSHKELTHSLAVSLQLISKDEGRHIRVVDLDCQKKGFPHKELGNILNSDTFIDYSPSGEGYHLWYSFNVRPKPQEKITGIDDVTGFVTLTGKIYKNKPVAKVNFTEEQQTHTTTHQSTSDKKSKLSLMNGHKQSIAYVTNLNYDIESILLENEFYRKGNVLAPPESTTGNPRRFIFPSNNNPYDLFFCIQRNWFGVDASQSSHRV